MELIISAWFVGLILFLLGAEKKKKKKEMLQCVNSILETKERFQQMNAYEFIQLVSGSDVNYKQRRNDHPSPEEPILSAPPAHLHSTYWHCFTIKRALMLVYASCGWAIHRLWNIFSASGLTFGERRVGAFLPRESYAVINGALSCTVKIRLAPER